jgi:methionine biosynthesis protein MetW
MSYLERVFRATEELNRRTILAVLEPRPGGVLLDLGCGDGALTERVAARVQATRKLGVETWEPFAAQARARGIEVFDVDLGKRLPFDDRSIDVVHSNQVIEHLPFTDHFLKEIRRVLRPGGQAVVSTNNLASWHNIVSLVLGWQPMPCHVSDEVIVGNPAGPMEGASGTPGQMHLRIFTSRALAQLAAHHGLDVEVERTAGYYPLPPALARVATRLDRRHGAFLVQRYGVPA